MNEDDCIKKVKIALSENGIKAEHMILKDRCKSARDAVVAAGVGVECVVKTVLFDCDGRTLACILCGDDRVDVEKLCNLCKEKPRLLSSREILERTGYPAGGVPPFGYDAIFIIDRRVMGMKEVYCGGGSERALVKTTPQEIMKVNKGLVDNIRA